MREILVEVAYDTDPRLYPQSEEDKLKLLLAKQNGVKSSQIVVSVGGDHVIEIIFSLLQRGDPVTAVSPTFSMWTCGYPGPRRLSWRAARHPNAAYEDAKLQAAVASCT